MKKYLLLLFTLLFAAMNMWANVHHIQGPGNERPAGNGGMAENYGSPSAFDNPNYYYAAIKTAPSGVVYIHACLSPDGTKIVVQKEYTDGSYSRKELFLMNADGSGETMITPGNSGQGDIYGNMLPFWSDDGSAIGYLEVHYANPNKVVKYVVSGGATSYIYEPVTPLDAANPDFLGNSTTSIVFWDWIVADGAADLYTWNGSTRTNITSSTGYSEYEPVSNSDGTVILYWSGETTAEPVNTTHTLTYSGDVWTKDVGFTPIVDSYWPYFSTRSDNYIGVTVMSSKDVHIYSGAGSFVLDLTGPGYSGGSGQWNFFGIGFEGPNGEMLMTSNGGRTLPGRDLIMAVPRNKLFVNAATGNDNFPGTINAPFATVQKANAEIIDNGTVYIYPGVYNSGTYVVVNKVGVSFLGVDAGGAPITLATNVVATVGPYTGGEADMVFHVIADDITISSIRIADNNNKAMTINGDNFTLTNCRFENQWDLSGSIYFYDASPGIKSTSNPSVQQTFTITGNIIKGWGVAITDGTGCGWPASDRVISNNTFGLSTQYPGYTFWSIGFRSVNGTGWCNSPVGGATITGNTFKDMGTRGYVYFDGNVPAEGLDWNAILANNTFELGAALAFDPSGTPRISLPSDPFYNAVTKPNMVYLKNKINNEIAKAQDGDLVKVLAGTYAEALNVNKVITLDGAGSGSDPLSNTVINGPGSGIGLALISGTSNSVRMVIKDIYVTNFFTGIAPLSYTTLDNVTSALNVGESNRGIELGNLQDLILNNCHINGNWVGMRAGTAADIDNVTITNSEFNGNIQGWFIAKASGADVSDFSNVSVSYTHFDNNTQKGMYVEKLSDALFDHITVTNSGTDAGYGFNNGIDINLKYQAYQNITFQNSTITGCGSYGTATLWDTPAAVAIKARDDASNYNGDPASLANVTINNCTISGPENALRFGESGKINAGPTNVDVHNCTLIGAKTHSNTGFGLINKTNSRTDATCNYWGTMVPSEILAKISGDVGADPFNNATLTSCTNHFPFANSTTGEGYLNMGAAIADAEDGDHIDINNPGNSTGITVNKPGKHIHINNTSGGAYTFTGASPAMTVTTGTTVTVNNVTYTTATDDPTVLVQTGATLNMTNCTVTESTGPYDQSCISVSGNGVVNAGTSGLPGHNKFFSDGFGMAVTSTSSAAVNAIGNYWGSTEYVDIVSQISGTGTVNFDPWCNSNFTQCGYTANVPGPITYAGKVVKSPIGSGIVIPITVENFANVDAISLKIKYNPAILTFVKGDDLQGVFSWGDYDPYADVVNGYVYISAISGSGQSFTGPTVLLNLYFTSILTGTSLLEWTDNGISCEYQNALTQMPFVDTPFGDYYKNGWVTDMSVTFTRTYSPTVQTITAVPAGGTKGVTPNPEYTFSWSGPAGFTGGSTATITPVLYSYGDYTVTITDGLGAVKVGTYNYNKVHNTNSFFDFATINGAISAGTTAGGHTLVADPGTYEEYVIVSKSLDIRGPNYGITPNPAIPGPRTYDEAVIMPPSVNTTTGYGVSITASNVSVNGFIIDGDNPAIGTSIDAYCGIWVFTNGLNNINISKNIICNFNRGMRLMQATNYFPTSSSVTYSTGNVINDNLVKDMVTYGIVLGQSLYAAVTDNVINNVSYGVTLYSHRITNPGGPAYQVISGNKIQCSDIGIWFNLNAAEPYTVSGNEISAVTDPSVTDWYGIMLSTVSAPQNLVDQPFLPLATTPVYWSLLNNIIDGSTLEPAVDSYGYWLWSVDDNRDNLGVDHYGSITGGTVSGVDVGVFMHNVDNDPNTVFGIGRTGAHASLSNLSISILSGGRGIYLKDDPTWIWANIAPLVAKRDVNLTMGTNITVTGGTQGLFIEQPFSSVQGSVNNIAFSGQSGNYIELLTNPNDINAIAASFDGETGATANLTENYAIEDKILHKLDNSTLGLVRVNAAELFVTQNSGSIQRGIDAATAGDIINVNNGTFGGNINVSKSLTLKGAYFGTPGCDVSRTGAESVIAGTTTAVTIAANNVTIDGFQITGATGISSTGFNGLNASNNEIFAGVYGILAVPSTVPIIGLTLEDNCVDLLAQVVGTGPYTTTAGFVVSGLGGTASAINNNIVTDGFYGYVLHAIGSSTVTKVIGGSITGVMQGVAIVNTLDGINLFPSNTGVQNVNMSAFFGVHPEVPAANFQAGVYTYTAGATVPGTGITLNIDGVTISGTQTLSPASAGIYLGDFSTGGSIVQNVIVNACTLNGNTNRGIDARGFVNVDVIASSLTNNGGAAWGTGDNNGYAVIAQKGAVVDVSNCFITHPTTSTYPVYAFQTGNAPDNTINAWDNKILMNGNANGWGASTGSGPINATCNYWGVTSVSGVGALMAGTPTYMPWSTDPTDVGGNAADGFQPTPYSCNGMIDYHVNDASLAGDVYIMATGSDLTGTGTQANPYATLGKAVSVAVVGAQKVYVDAGLYSEQALVNKTLDIRGSNYNISPNGGSRNAEAVINGGGSGGAIPVTITANNVLFNGFKIQNSGTTGTEAGIMLANGSTGVTGCTISYNELTGNINGMGVALGSGNSIVINNVHHNAAYGILLIGTTGNTLESNTIAYQTLDGIALDNAYAIGGPITVGSTGNYIKTNIISNIGRDGIFIGENCSGNHITVANNLSSIGSNGINIWRPSNQTIQNNIITGCTAAGIRLLGSSNNTITGNAITVNGTGVLLERSWQLGVWYPCTNNTIHHNNISGNTAFGMVASDNEGTTVVAENNWWGDAKGPIHATNPCGTGNAVTDYVDFSPWFYQVGMTTLNGLTPISMTDIPEVSTITATPVILATTVGYQNDIGNYDPDVLTDAKFTITDAGKYFPDNARVISVKYYGSELLTGSYNFPNGVNSIYLSDILGIANPLAGHNGLSIPWEFTLDGFDQVQFYNMKLEAVSYITTKTNCNNLLGTELFKLTFANPDAYTVTTGVTTACYTDSLTFSVLIDYPAIVNVNTAIKADASIVSDVPIPAGSRLDWNLNGGAATGTYTFPSATTSIMLSTIVGGGAPYPLVGHNNVTDTWAFELISSSSPLTDIDLTIQPVAVLGVNYPYATGYANDLNVITCGISGKVRYHNSANTLMNNVEVELWQGTKKYPITGIVKTGSLGEYSFTNVASGNYEVRLATAKPVAGSLNSTDAAQVNNWYAHGGTIEKARFFAGDVKGDNTGIPNNFAGSTDAQLIQGKFVQGVAFDRVNWTFWRAGESISANPSWAEGYLYPEITVSTAAPNQSNINFYGLATGDFNRSFVPNGTKAGTEDLELVYLQTYQVNASTEIEMPVYTVNPISVGAVSMILNFPADLVEVMNVSMNMGGQLDWSVKGNELRIGWNTQNPVSLAGGAELLTLSLRTRAEFIQGNEIRFTLANSSLNELADDYFEVIPDAVLSMGTLESTFFGINEQPDVVKVSLSNHPNPFKDYTMIAYALPFEGRVTLDVYSILGTKVATLVDARQAEGNYMIEYHTTALEPGVYIATLKFQGNNQSLTRSIKIVRN